MERYGDINILGTWYQVINQTEEENPKIFDKDGMCEPYAKKIVIDTSSKTDKDAVENIDDYFHAVLRHECFHAIFHEIGHGADYCRDEVLVDLLALLYPKIKKIMDAADNRKID